MEITNRQRWEDRVDAAEFAGTVTKVTARRNGGLSTATWWEVEVTVNGVPSEADDARETFTTRKAATAGLGRVLDAHRNAYRASWLDMLDAPSAPDVRAIMNTTTSAINTTMSDSTNQKGVTNG